MAIFLTGQSRVMIQGITGSEGRRHGARMLAAGTRVVGGTNPRKAGQTVELNGTDVPVFGTVADTMAATGADVSVVFVPASGTKDAVIEAIEAQIPLCIVITEGIPVHDTAEFWARASAAGNRTRIIGPNCPGVASPGQVQRRHHPGRHHHRGPDRPGLQVGHADLPDDVRAARHRLLHRRRHRRRPGDRDHAHRLPAGLRGGPGDRRHRDDRRDRRRRRGAGRGLHRAARDQARRGLRGRVHRARRARRWATPARSSPAPRAPPRPRRKPWRRPASASARPPARPPASSATSCGS